MCAREIARVSVCVAVHLICLHISTVIGNYRLFFLFVSSLCLPKKLTSAISGLILRKVQSRTECKASGITSGSHTQEHNEQVVFNLIRLIGSIQQYYRNMKNVWRKTCNLCIIYFD